MSVYGNVGTFNFTTNNTSDIVITGLGFQPVALITFGTNLRNNTTTNLNTGSVAFGFSGGTRDAQGSVSFDSIGRITGFASSSVGMTNIYCHTIYSCATEGTLAAIATASFQSDGFTVSVPATPQGSYRINYLAIGGSTVTASIGSGTLSSGVGTSSISSVGFQPDAVLFIYGAQDNTTFNGVSKHPQIGFGWAANSSSQGTVSIAGADSGSALNNPLSSLSNTRVMVWTTGSGTTPLVGSDVQLYTMDSSGFTLHKRTSDIANASKFFYCAIKGLGVLIGTGSESNTLNFTQSIATPFIPKGLLMMSSYPSTSSIGTTSVTSSNIAFGGLSSQSSAFQYASINYFNQFLSSPLSADPNDVDLFQVQTIDSPLINFARISANTFKSESILAPVSFSAVTGGIALTQTSTASFNGIPYLYFTFGELQASASIVQTIRGYYYSSLYLVN